MNYPLTEVVDWKKSVKNAIDFIGLQDIFQSVSESKSAVLLYKFLQI